MPQQKQVVVTSPKISVKTNDYSNSKSSSINSWSTTLTCFGRNAPIVDSRAQYDNNRMFVNPFHSVDSTRLHNFTNSSSSNSNNTVCSKFMTQDSIISCDKIRPMESQMHSRQMAYYFHLFGPDYCNKLVNSMRS